MKKKEVELLREYIRSSFLVKEYYDGDYGGTSGGGTYASSGVLKKAFVDPLVDIFRVFKGRSKETFSSLKNLAKVSLSGVASIATGGTYKADYEGLNKKYSEEIKKIRDEYGKDYAKSWDVLEKSGFMTQAFLFNPVAYITASAIRKNPTMAAKAMAAMVIPATPVAMALGAVAAASAASGALQAAATSKIAEKSVDKLLRIKKGNGDDSLTSNINPELLNDKKKTNESVDSYFEQVKSKLSKLKNAKTIEDLNLSQEQKSNIEKQLSKIKEQENYDEVVDTIVKTSKQQIVFKELQFIKKQRDQSIQQQKNSGISDDIIFHPQGIVSRYNQEISKIASMFDLSEKAD